MLLVPLVGLLLLAPVLPQPPLLSLQLPPLPLLRVLMLDVPLGIAIDPNLSLPLLPMARDPDLPLSDVSAPYRYRLSTRKERAFDRKMELEGMPAILLARMLLVVVPTALHMGMEEHQVKLEGQVLQHNCPTSLGRRKKASHFREWEGSTSLPQRGLPLSLRSKPFFR